MNSRKLDQVLRPTGGFVFVGYSESLRNGGPAETAEGALLGVAGIFIMTASGVFIGYWLARAGYVGRTHGAIRFLK